MTKRRKRWTKENDDEALQFVKDAMSRVDWLFHGHYPDPPDWEKPLIAEVMRRAMHGDDAAIVWLKDRFPPQAIQ